MKKVIALGLVILSLVFSTPSYAAFKISKDGTSYGQAQDMNFTTGLSVAVAGNEATISTTLITSGRTANATLVMNSSTTPITDSSLPYAVILKSVGGVVSTDNSPGTTLPNGTDGQTLSIIIVGLQPGGTWLLTPTTKTGFNSLTFDTKGDTVTLLYVNSTIGWIIQSNGGAVVNQS